MNTNNLRESRKESRSKKMSTSTDSSNSSAAILSAPHKRCDCCPRKLKHDTTLNKQRCQLVAAIFISILIAFVSSGSAVKAQSTKGGGQQVARASANSYAPAPSPITQLRQQQQTYAPAPVKPNSIQSTKRRPQQQQQQQQQQTQYTQQKQEAQANTEDPLADSEPALYGSVAGKPGVDFPGYTRIPKTSFTCEGKGFDFGFYADEEAGCQVYHVCWSGRRESFLCGIGTVFNQAILACDYWHSVDCSKSSQFYGVNSELGKAGAEPAAGGGGSLRINSPTSRPQAALPSAPVNYGENLNKQRNTQQAAVGTQQQQYNVNDDAFFDAPQQQQQQQVAEPAPISSQFGTKGGEGQQQQVSNSYSTGSTFAPIRSSQAQSDYSQQQQQQRINSDTKSAAQVPARNQLSAPPPAAAVKRARFNMDFNQKVNSLIESPVRPPIKSPPAPVKQPQRQPQPQPQQQPQSVRAPNYAQLAVSRAQQSGSQALNSPARKSPPPQVNSYQQVQQRQSSFDAELDEPQPQQQLQQTFDDSPVQTSTAQSTIPYGSSSRSPINQQSNINSNNNNNKNINFIPQAQQLVVQSGGSGDGSSAITTQYDTISPALNGPQQQQQLANSGNSNQQDQNYDSQLDDPNSNGSSDDFKSSGAKAAASHNQNWYIMRSI